MGMKTCLQPPISLAARAALAAALAGVLTAFAAPSAAHAAMFQGWGVAINKGWLHFTHEVGKAVLPDKIPASKNGHPTVVVGNPFARPAPACIVAPAPISFVRDPGINVTIENKSDFTKYLEVFDVQGNAWVFGGLVAAHGRVPVKLTTDYTGTADAVVLPSLGRHLSLQNPPPRGGFSFAWQFKPCPSPRRRP